MCVCVCAARSSACTDAYDRLFVVVILSVSVATIVAPALLALLGPNVNRWQIGRGDATDRTAVMTFVDAALRRPILAAAVKSAGSS